MGLSKKDQERFDTIDKQAYKMFKKGISIAEIAKTFGIKRQCLSKRLKAKYDIEVLPDGKKYVDSDYFEIIDNEEKAYWLGFLLADGYNAKNNSIELALKDKEHIKKFKKAIKSKHKISKKKSILNSKLFTSYRISIKDAKMSKDLVRHECINNKSLCLKLPIILDYLYAPLIRGIFDGDGSLSADSRNCKIPRISISSGCKEFLEDIQFVLNQYNIDLKIYKGQTCYNLMSTRKDEALKFLDYIYKDSLESQRLNRKYELYQYFCRLNSKPLES